MPKQVCTVPRSSTVYLEVDDCAICAYPQGHPCFPCKRSSGIVVLIAASWLYPFATLLEQAQPKSLSNVLYFEVARLQQRGQRSLRYAAAALSRFAF